MSILRLLGAAGALLLVLASPAAAHKRHHHHHKPKDVKVQLLAFNDFHGNLQTSTTGGIRIDPPPVRPPPTRCRRPAAGGAAILGSYVRELERGNRNSLLVSAGDLIGASPLVSALYHDEPTIEAMNQLGLDLNAVGNHEFDEGEEELKRMQRGGCHPNDGCETGHTFEGADFKFLAANVVRKDNASTLFKPYAIRRFQGKKIGFIGMTLEGTPSIVSPSGIRNLNFLDEAATANRYARSSGASTASRRSSCCSTRAVSRTVHVQHQPGHVHGLRRLRRADRRHRQQHHRRRRPVHHRPHAPAVRLRDRRPPGHELQLVRPAPHRHRPHARPQRRHQRRAGRRTSRCTRRAARRIGGSTSSSSSTRSARGRSAETVVAGSRRHHARLSTTRARTRSAT